MVFRLVAPAPAVERRVQTPRCMKIAFATRDLEHVDAHFGTAPYLVVYEVTARGWQRQRTLSFELLDDARRGVDEMAPRLAAILGAAVVYVAAIGPSHAARLAASGIRPATAAGKRIEDLLGFLARLVGVSSPSSALECTEGA
jgi:nitrogen fixation protein NifX